MTIRVYALKVIKIMLTITLSNKNIFLSLIKENMCDTHGPEFFSLPIYYFSILLLTSTQYVSLLYYAKFLLIRVTNCVTNIN